MPAATALNELERGAPATRLPDGGKLSAASRWRG